MRQFKIRENGFREIRKQILERAIPLSVIAALVGMAIFLFSNWNGEILDISYYLILFIPVLGSLAFGISRALKRQKKIYDTYLLTVDENGITREQFNTPSIHLPFSEITSITKNKNGGFLIKGKSFVNAIIVFPQIDDLKSLEDILNEHCPIQVSTSKPLMQQLTIPLVILTLILMIITYVSTNKILVTFSGTALLIIMTWSFITIQKGKNFDKKTKRSSYWSIIVILSIVGIIISKLMM